LLAGTVVSLKGIAEGRLHPKACLFAGLPLDMISSRETDVWWKLLCAEYQWPGLVVRGG